MLNFEEGQPIAVIKKGKNQGQILRISENEEKETNRKENPLEYITEKEIRQIIKNQKGKCTAQDLEEYIEMIANNETPENSEDEEIYNKSLDLIDNKIKKEIKIKDGFFVPFPVIKNRQCFYISGPSGSGKSYFISQYLSVFKRLKPKMKVFLFSEKNEDEVLDKYHPLRVKIDDELLEDLIDPLKELKNSVVIFDDVDSISDKNIKKEVYDLMNKCLKLGRSYNIYTLISTHMMSNYNETRHFISESQFIVLFKQGTKYFLEQFLKKYCGFSQKQINQVLTLPSRWFCIHKNVPQYILYEKGCYLLN